MTQYLRSPIVGVLGHVDHGKTTLLDKIRGSEVAKKEAGGITQMVGASYVKKEHIENLSKGLSQKLGINIIIPGLLFIDTPGHEAFSNLRDRGGSIADIAILVIDAMQGIQPQTIESINILKRYKTPFVIAMNKIDLIKGWKPQNTYSILESMGQQNPFILEKLDEFLYNIVGKMGEYGLNAERFDRIKDFTRNIAIIPTSAKSGEGIAELLILIAGLAQKYLKDNLYISPESFGKGSIIEVKEEKGMGLTLDAILYDGVLKKGDIILVPTKKGIKETKVRGLFQPNIASNNPKEKYRAIKKVIAAAGVKILTSGIEDVIPGAPFGVKGGIDQKELENYIKDIIFSSENLGVIVKADSLGSAEALLNLLKENNIPVRKIDIGKPTKEDIVEAEVLKEKNYEFGVVLAFNVPTPKEIIALAQQKDIAIISHNVIYKLIEEYIEWKKRKSQELYKKMLSQLPLPVKIKILPNHIFRISKPAIVGIEILEGTLVVGTKLMDKEGNILGEVKSIQLKKESLKEAKKDEKVAIAIDRAVAGKDFEENDILYSALTKKEIELWEENLKLLDESSREALKEIKNIVVKAKFKKK